MIVNKMEKDNCVYDGAIILDIDNTLVYTFNKPPTSKQTSWRKNSKYMHLRKRVYHYSITIYERDKRTGDIIEGGKHDKFEFWGSSRPFVNQFLTFCYRYFKYLIIWSAGHYDYVHTVVDFLFKDLPFRPDLIYTHLDTTFNDNGTLKPLEQILFEHPELEELNIKKMIIVDDTESTFEFTNALNGILIPVYRPKPDPESMIGTDVRLLQILQMFLLNNLANCDDIRKIDLKSTFDFTPEEYLEMMEEEEEFRNHS